MATKLEIVNMALANIGHQPVTSLSAAVPAIDFVNAFYDQVRKDLLSLSAWPFARKTAVPEAIEPQDDGWQATYPYPDDCLRVLNVYPDGYAQSSLSAPTEIPWERTENGISCDVSDGVVVRYTKDLGADSEATWPPEFVDIFAWCLSARIALGVTANASVVSNAENQYRQRVQLAINRSAREDKRRRETGTSIYDARQ